MIDWSLAGLIVFAVFIAFTIVREIQFARQRAKAKQLNQKPL